MGLTPDQAAGPSDEEEVQFEDRGPAGDSTGDPTAAGALRRVTNALRFFVGGAVRQVLQAKNPPTGFDDIDLTGIASGQGLAYNATSKQFEPQTFAGGGYDSAVHRAEDQLVHTIAEDSFEEVSRTGNKVDSIIVWTTAGKTQKIREELYTYSGNQVTTIVTKQYDAAGVLVPGETMTETFNYTGSTLNNITRVMS